MFYYILYALSGILGLLIRGAFLDHVMLRNPYISRSFFWISSCIAGIVLYLYTILSSGTYTITKMIISVIVNNSVNLVLTYFYLAKHIYQRMPFVLLFYSFSAAAEFVSASLLYTLIANFSEKPSSVQDAYIMIGCDLSLLILIFLFKILPLKQESDGKPISSASLRQTLLSISTPLFSIILLFLFSHFHMLTNDSESSLPIFFIVVLMLNIINYILLNNLAEISIIEKQIQLQKKQLDIQAVNYEKISDSYKEIRKIIHEMKRFNSYILNCAENNNCDKIIDYIMVNSSEMEKRLLTINTGNIVIDSLLSNYEITTSKYNIQFSINIGINTEDVPLNDYDLCILLGNLLDNALNAAKLLVDKAENSSNKNYIKLEIKTKERFFVIHIENSYLNTKAKNTTNPDFLSSHGYGLINVKEIVGKYNGIYFQSAENSIYKTTISIPILRDSIGAIIRQPQSYERYTPSIHK